MQLFPSTPSQPQVLEIGETSGNQLSNVMKSKFRLLADSVTRALEAQLRTMASSAMFPIKDTPGGPMELLQ
ncbi:hypothetical protein Tco_0639877 [Tanacetum coccineum]